MKRVLCWLCFVMALSLWPQTALADPYYIAYNVTSNDSGWQNADGPLRQNGDTWYCTIPAGEGKDSKYFIIIGDSQIIGNDGWNASRYGGNTTLTTSAQQLSIAHNSNEALSIEGMAGKSVTVKIQKVSDTQIKAWYEVASGGETTDKPLSDLTNLPDNLYVSYRVDGGAWVFSQPMTKNTTNWSYNLAKCGSKVEFAITKGTVSSENELKDTSSDKKIQYTFGTYNDANPQETAPGQELKLYGRCGHWLQISKGGSFAITMTPTDGLNEGFRNMIFNYTENTVVDPNPGPGPGPGPDPEESGFYFGFLNTSTNWMHNQPVYVSDGVYSFSFNSIVEQAQFYITSEDKNGWPDKRFFPEDLHNNIDVTSGFNNLPLIDRNCGNIFLISGAKDKCITVTFSMTNGKITSISYTKGEIVIPDFTGHLYYGYHGDYGKWTHEGTELLPDADGYYSFTMKNSMSQNQYFYITDCGPNGMYRLSNGFPLFRYVADDSAVADTEIGKDGNLDLGRYQTRTVCYVPDSKNHNITVKFRYDKDANCVTDLTCDMSLIDGVNTDERTKTNLPLLPRNFISGSADAAPVPHYFIVGTRMADWRLQPEWEMTKISDTQYEISSPRVMYTGLVSVAKVSRYDNYSNNRYYRYSSEGGADFRPGNASAALVNKGPFAFYRDNAPTPGEADRFFSKSSDGGYVDATILQDGGVVCDKIILTVDAEGNPVNLEFVYTEKPVTDYITLSLVGSNIVNTGLPKADYTQAAIKAAKTSTWQDAWVQYNPETGVPYRDASGMLIYQTVFQADWLDRHPTFFNKKINVGSERNRADYEFNYTSASIIMRNANSFSEEELLEDQYADYYDRFANSSRNTLGGGQEVNLEGFKFTEKMLFHNAENSLVEQSLTSDKWQCFVVKDMWMDDFFKIWTGWGGGRMLNEGTGNGLTAARWYYANGGHGHQDCNHAGGHCAEANVQGFDIMKKDNQVNIYGTDRDISAADFFIDGLTYFKRVIVWYDPAEGFDKAAVQLIIERCGPAIKALRGVKGSEIDYLWNIQDPGIPLDENEKKLPVTGYRIYRYRLDNATGKWIADSDGPVKTVTCTSGETIGDFMADQTATNSGLNAGTYRYKVEVDMVDAAGLKLTRDAWSNRVTLFDASVPVKGSAHQLTEEKDGKTLYSFDMQLTLDLNSYLVSALYEGHSINDLAEGYYVTVDPEVMDDFNNARRVGADGSASPCLYTCSGHSKAEDTEEALEIPQFTYDPSNPLQQMVNGQLVASDRAWIHIPFSKGHIAKTLVWENMVKTHPEADYKFELFLKRNPEYETIFAAANFGMAEVVAPMYIPGMEVEYKGSNVVTDNGGDEPDAAEQIFAGKFTPEAAMPMGAHNGGALVAPVHYTQANRLDAEFAVDGPAVTDKVKANFNLAYAGAAAEMERGALPAVDGFDAIASQKGIDVTAMATALEVEADGKQYFTLAEDAAVPVFASADVTYSRKDDAETRSMQPVAMGAAKGEAALDLQAPDFSVTARATTNEQNGTDGKRYYVHELQAKVNFTNLSTQTMVVRPGFHLHADVAREAEFKNDFGNSANKAANGGIVAYASDKIGGADFYSFFDGYTPFTDGEYNNAAHNWARMACRTSTLPVYIDYFSAVEKTASSSDADWKYIPGLDGSVAYHYPFIVMSGASADVRARADATENNIKTLTMRATPDSGVEIEVMTSISGVEADTDLSGAEFFNLQGIRVAQPQPGQVYLVRRGTEVTKMLFR